LAHAALRIDRVHVDEAAVLDQPVGDLIGRGAVLVRLDERLDLVLREELLRRAGSA